MSTTLRPWARQAQFSLAHLAAILLLLASAAANFRYGLELGQTPLEKLIAAGASIGADVWCAVGFIVAAGAFAKAKWGQGVAASLVLCITLLYSVNAGIGFAASTRGEMVGRRAATERVDQLAQVRLRQVETQLQKLDAVPGNGGRLQARIEAILADRRSGGCTVMDGRYTKANCPEYFALKAQLSTVNEKAQLEAERVALTEKLGTTSSLAPADPASASIAVYLSKLGLSVPAGGLLPWQTLMFVLMVVLGGPLALWLAEARCVPDQGPATSTKNQTSPTMAAPDATATVDPNKSQVMKKPTRSSNVIALTPHNKSAARAKDVMGAAEARQARARKARAGAGGGFAQVIGGRVPTLQMAA